MGLAPNGSTTFTGDSGDCEVPASIFSQPRRVVGGVLNRWRLTSHRDTPSSDLRIVTSIMSGSILSIMLDFRVVTSALAQHTFAPHFSVG